MKKTEAKKSRATVPLNISQKLFRRLIEQNSQYVEECKVFDSSLTNSFFVLVLIKHKLRENILHCSGAVIDTKVRRSLTIFGAKSTEH